MTSANLTKTIDALAGYLRSATRIACLTGAGMSTESGIPDYRSSSTGLYRTLTSEEVFDIQRFRSNPSDFYRVIGPLYISIEEAKPNAGHLALAELAERCGKSVKIATQNIDGLHQKAGRVEVYEVHGTMRTLTCQRCGGQVDSSGLRDSLQAGELLRHHCNGVLKPDITFYGEMLPSKPLALARQAMIEADLVIVLGTSLLVYPAAALPSMRSQGCPLVIINRDAIAMDDQASLVINDSIGSVLPQAVAKL